MGENTFSHMCFKWEIMNNESSICRIDKNNECLLETIKKLFFLFGVGTISQVYISGLRHFTMLNVCKSTLKTIHYI